MPRAPSNLSERKARLHTSEFYTLYTGRISTPPTPTRSPFTYADTTDKTSSDTDTYSPKFPMFFFVFVCASRTKSCSDGFFQEKPCHYTNGLARTAPWHDRLLNVHNKALKGAPPTASCSNLFLCASQRNTNSQRFWGVQLAERRCHTCLRVALLFDLTC